MVANRAHSWARRLPVRVLRRLAAHHHWLGRYDERTAAWYHAAWERSGDPADLLLYLQFERERGELASDRLLETLRAGVDALPADLRLQAWERLIEGGSGPSPAERVVLHAHSAAQSFPPLAACLAEAGLPLPRESAALAAWHRDQGALRDSFAGVLAARTGPICVVGNAGTLRGGGLGERIDGQGAVVRFNRFRSDATGEADLGRRIDVWVCAPNFLPEAQQMLARGCPQPDWLVLSGPDVRYHRAGISVPWRRVLEMHGAGLRTVTVPLGIWRSLTRRLAAPPSAGLLFLAWSHALLGGWESVRFAGFDGGRSKGRPYHHAGRRIRPGRRHAWGAERTLLSEWDREGLRSIRDEAGN